MSNDNSMLSATLKTDYNYISNFSNLFVFGCLGGVLGVFWGVREGVCGGCLGVFWKYLLGYFQGFSGVKHFETYRNKNLFTKLMICSIC